MKEGTSVKNLHQKSKIPSRCCLPFSPYCHRWLIIVLLFIAIMVRASKATSHYTPQAINSYSYYHTTTKPLYDFKFNIAINVELQSSYWSLQIVMGQCHSGGFVDDLAESPADEFSIATSCRWDRVTWALVGRSGFNPFLRLWEERVEQYPNHPWGGAYAAWNYARNNYLSYLPNHPRYVQDPQYFSRPDSQDAETPNPGCFDNFIILVLGDDTTWDDWNELERIHDLMTYTYGYMENRIYVYADHQKLPDGNNAPFWVDGEGSKENILDAISLIGQRLSGWDRIFIWFAGHGGLATPATLQSKSRAIPPDDSENWVVSLEAGFSSSLHSSAMLEVAASGVEEDGIEVLLNDVLLGCLEEGTGTTLVPVPAGLYVEGENVIQFQSGQSSEATISEVLVLSGYPSDEVWPEDLNFDGDVDFLDFAKFAIHWLETDCGTCDGTDLTGEGNVDLSDLEKFIENWLTGVE